MGRPPKRKRFRKDGVLMKRYQLEPGPRIRQAGGRLSEEGRRRRLAVGVPPDLIDQPLWLIAQTLGISSHKLNLLLASCASPQDQATTGTG